MDLFEYMKSATLEKESPLAARLRPTTLEEVVGQSHIIGESGPCLSSSVAVHPLRSANHRRLGEQLPHQLANDTRAHLIPINLWL